MDDSDKNTLNPCQLHPERQAAGRCIGCSEFFCAECLDAHGNCPSCGAAAERFLEGFSGALSRWGGNLKEAGPQLFETASGAGKSSKLKRILIRILAVLAGSYSLYWLSHYNILLGQMFFEQGNIPKALYHFEKAAAGDPSDADLRYILGNIYYQQGTMTEAMKAYRECVELDSTNAGAMNNLAWLYSQMEIRLEEALDLSRRSLEIDPDNPIYLDTLAEIYYMKKEYYRALTYLRKAVEQNPPNLEYYTDRLEKIKRLAYGQNKLLEV